MHAGVQAFSTHPRRESEFVGNPLNNSHTNNNIGRLCVKERENSQSVMSRSVSRQCAVIIKAALMPSGTLLIKLSPSSCDLLLKSLFPLSLADVE